MIGDALFVLGMAVLSTATYLAFGIAAGLALVGVCLVLVSVAIK